MKNRIARILILASVLWSFGCADQSNSQPQPNEDTPLYADLSELTDENYISVEQIEHMQESDDETMDVEDQYELMSRKDKILIVGDSWAAFPCAYNSMSKMIRDVNANIKEDNRCMRTTKLGVAGFEWIGSKQDLRTIKFLKETPRLKYLYLSMGGNDMMAVWHKSFTAEQELEVYKSTAVTVKKIMDRYLSIRPDIKIILAGYDYPNFTKNHTISLYREIFKRMGEPEPERINYALAGLCQHLSHLANGKNIFYIQHLGLSHYYHGNEDKGLSPLKTLSPDKISPMHDPTIIGGNIKLPSSKKSMINWLFIIRDAFHLNTRMYRKVMHHTYNNLLSHIIEPDDKLMVKNY